MMGRSVADILDGVERLDSKYPGLLTNQSPDMEAEIGLSAVINALNSFTDCVRYLNTRRSDTLLKLDSESAVQDALYLMLRPWIHDLLPENPTDKVGNRYSIKDFVSISNRIVIEIKYVRSKDHGKALVKELNDDIETYRYHHACDDLVFFIYDPDACIPDSAALNRHISEERKYGTKTLRCHCVIKP